MFSKKGMSLIAVLGLLIFSVYAAAGPNANAVLSLDLIADGGAGNGTGDGVTSGTVSGQGTTIAIEIFATGVRTSLIGMTLEFDFDSSLLSFVEAENSAFSLAVPAGSTGTLFGTLNPARLASSGFLARAEFTTVSDVTGTEFSIGIESVTLAENTTSSDELITTSVITFNASPSPDFDGDDFVGFSDFLIFASVFGSRRGDGTYDARIDLNSDGSIGFTDFLIFAQSFGSAPPSTGGGSPDLVVQSPSVSDNNVASGATFTLGATVRNQGNGSSAATTLHYYRSDDATVSTSDTEVGTDAVRGLAAGRASNESISLTSPSSEGTYYYGACVAAVDGEGDTRNNCSPSVRVIVEEVDTTPVNIPDANLRAAIEAALGKTGGATITVAEMTRLTRLDATEAGIGNLTGLQFATNLREAVLWENRIRDISPLSGLINLGTLSLMLNNITDLSPLSGLINLTELTVGEGPISDLSPLSGLSRLRSLVVFGTSNTDLSPLSGLTNLRELGLNHGKTEDISALAGLTNLRRLNLFHNQIEDISALSGLTNLTHLTASKNKISDISALSGLTNLTNLWLTENNIKDVSPLSGLINLIWLGLDANSIEDISPLSGLTNLYYLGLSANSIEDISPLSGLTNLYKLELRGNPYETLPKGDFDIELVLLDDFTESQKNVLQYVARRWMLIIMEDLPDYEFTQGWAGQCGSQSFEIPAGERIDDLRIYVAKLPSSGVGPHGRADLSVLREATHLPVLGCMVFDLSHANLLITGLHEIGHVLGVGTRVWDNLGFRQDPKGDEHFNGPLAIAAFDDAGGRNYTGAKVPVDGSHWRVGVFGDELMTPTGSGAISAITVQSLADLGYGVDLSQADAYTLPSAASAKASAKIAALPPTPDAAPLPPSILGDGRLQGLENAEWTGGRGFDLRNGLMRRLTPSPRAVLELSCGAGLRQEPIHVVDPQGRIIRTLGD